MSGDFFSAFGSFSTISENFGNLRFFLAECQAISAMIDLFGSDSKNFNLKARETIQINENNVWLIEFIDITDKLSATGTIIWSLSAEKHVFGHNFVQTRRRNKRVADSESWSQGLSFRMGLAPWWWLLWRHLPPGRTAAGVNQIQPRLDHYRSSLNFGATALKFFVGMGGGP